MATRILILLITTLTLAQAVTAQTTYNTQAAGNWHTGATWFGGSVPTNWANPRNHVNVNHNITATTSNSIGALGNITVASGITFTSSAGFTFTNIDNFVHNGGDVTINGDLSVTGGSVLTFNSGNLTVNGNLTIGNDSDVTWNSTGTMKVTGNMSSSGGGTKIIQLNSGKLDVDGNLSVNSGTTLNIASGVIVETTDFNVSSNSTAIVNLNGTATVAGSMDMRGTFNVGSTGVLDVAGGVSLQGGNAHLNVDGDVEIDGDLSLIGAGGGTPAMDISSIGSISVGQDFRMSGGTEAVVDGSLEVGDDIVLGNPSGGSSLNGTGTLTWGDTFELEDDGSAVNGNNFNNPPAGSPFSLASYSVVLPIKLAAFTVSESDAGILLKWTTSLEENFEYFSVQRSTNGSDFEEMAQIEGKGWSEVLNHYSFADEAAPAGRLYYRLQSYDFDGYTEVFHVLSIENKGAEAPFSAYPNPLSGDELTLSYTTTGTENITLSIFDKSGLLVKTVGLSSYQHTVDLSDLSQGVYVLRLSNSSQVFRLIKQ